jgi:hypothetical protein
MINVCLFIFVLSRLQTCLGSVTGFVSPTVLQKKVSLLEPGALEL